MRRQTRWEARLEFALKLDRAEFIGKEALLKVQARGLNRYLMGIRIVSRGISRVGSELIMENRKIGYVTSGTFSPTLKTGIAMGYVYSALPCGTEATVDIRGNVCRGIITEMPFYDQGKYGRTRTSTDAAYLKPTG
jgi:aminomethyltransferase